MCRGHRRCAVWITFIVSIREATISKNIGLVYRALSISLECNVSQNRCTAQAFVAKLISQLYDAAGLSTKPGEHFYRQHARSLAIRWACLYGYEACLVDTNTELQKVLNGTQRLHPDYRAAIMCAGARSADDHQYEQLWSQFSAHVDSNAARTQIIDTLACASRTDHLSMALGWTLDAVGHFDVATASERYRMLSALAGNRRALPLTLEVLAERFDEAVLRLGESNISAMVGVLARHVNNAELRAKVS